MIMDINKINKDMMRVLDDVQKVQQTFMLDFSMSVKVFHYQKGYRILVGFEDAKESEKQLLGAYQGTYRFECYQQKEDLKEMLDDLHKSAITLKHMRDREKAKMIEI